MTVTYANKAKSAVLWNAGFNVFRDVLQFVQMLVLARLLDEAAYGQFAFSMSVIGFLAVFSAAPFLAFTLQVQEESDTHYQDHFTAAGVLQFSMFLLANLVGLVIARLPAYAAAAPLVHVLSLTFLLEWSCELRRKMIERQFDFRTLRLLHAAGLSMAMITAIVMALTGCGAYSLVVPGMLVTLPFIYDLFVRKGWRPTWQFSWAHYRPAYYFGLSRIGSGVSLQGRTLLESTALAAMIGFGPLGIVNRAIGLATLACSKIASQLSYAIYPILTRLSKESGQAERAGNLLLRLVAWSAIPLAVSLSILAKPVVDTIYGSQWTAVAPLMKFTLMWAAVSALAQVTYTLVLARNRPRLCLTCDVIALLGTGLSLAFAIPYGIEVYLAAVTVVQLANLCILTFVLVHERAMTIRGGLQALSPPAISSLAGVSIAYLATHWTIGPPTTFMTAAVWGSIFAVGYVVVLRLAFTSVLEELIAFFPARNHLLRFLVLKST